MSITEAKHVPPVVADINNATLPKDGPLPSFDGARQYPLYEFLGVAELPKLAEHIIATAKDRWEQVCFEPFPIKRFKLIEASLATTDSIGELSKKIRFAWGV